MNRPLRLLGAVLALATFAACDDDDTVRVPGEPELCILAEDGSTGLCSRTDLALDFDGAASESHKAQALDSDTLAVRIRSLDYEDITDAFVRARSLEVSSPRLGGRIATFPLAGSNWAVNALDECRRLNTQS